MYSTPKKVLHHHTAIELAKEYLTTVTFFRSVNLLSHYKKKQYTHYYRNTDNKVIDIEEYNVGRVTRYLLSNGLIERYSRSRNRVLWRSTLRDSDHLIFGLIDALHYIKKFRDKIFIIKFSGDILLDENILESIATDLILLHDVGIRPVVIHGAGSLISSNMEKAGLKPKFIRGERVTDERTLDLVIGCLHHVNNKIIGRINRNTVMAVGLNCGLFKAKNKRRELGYVGEVVDINSELIYDLLERGYIPVIFPLGIDEEGNPLNINADIATGELAKAVNATKIILLTNVKGVLDEDGRLIRHLSISETRNLIESKIATKGMIPKLESSVKAISEGVERIHIIGAGKHAILGELLTKEGTGTMITENKL